MILFIADDPGGVDVLKPVFDAFCAENNDQLKFLLVGASKKKDEMYACEDEDAIITIQKYAEAGSLSILITGTSWGRTVELRAIKICKRYGVKTVSILDYWSNYKRRFLLNDEYVFPNYLFVPDQLAFRGCLEDGIPEGIIRVVGQPSLDYFIKKKFSFSSEKKALFLSQPLSMLYGMKLGFNEFTAFPLALSACEKTGFHLDVKFHPKESDCFKQKYKLFECEGEMHNVLSKYRCIIGMNTMALLQYFLSGMPIISFEPDMIGDDLCITNKLEITKPILNEKQLIEQLFNVKRVDVSNKQYIWLDGLSTKRCVNEIKIILRQSFSC